MAKENETFERQMERFAKSVIQKAGAADTCLKDITDAFKALTTYYAILRKYPGEPEDADVTFDGIQDEMRQVVHEENVKNGSTTPPIRDRRGH